MKKVTYLLAAATMCGGLALAIPASASPLTTGLNLGNAAVPQLDEGLVQKVHGWHCRRRWSDYRGWHRHRRACDDYGYGYGYPYGYGYGLGVAPFFSFGFFDDDDDHHHHHKWRRHHRRD
jgi:hypothetical protein